VTIWPRKHKRKTPSQAFTRSKQIYRIGRSLRFCETVHWKIVFNLGSTRGCAEPMLPFCRLKVKVTLKGKTLTLKIFLNLNMHLCPFYKSYIENPSIDQYIYWSIEGFSSNLAEMFTPTRGCAEPMLPMCQLKDGYGCVLKLAKCILCTDV